MSNDPSKPNWHGQQPTSFDPYTGQPVYAPAPPPQAPQGHGQHAPPPGYGQVPSPQGYGHAPPQGYGQPPQGGYGQPPYGQAPGFPSAGGLSAEPRPTHGHEPDGGDDHEDEDDSSGLRQRANATMNQSDRLRFIRLTYLHLFAAMMAFAGLLWVLFKVDAVALKVTVPLVKFAFGGRFNWAIVLAAFMAASWIADYWASHATSKPMQYIGLGLYVVAEALIFTPLIVIVMLKTESIIARGGGDPNILRDAAFTTIAIFAALTASVVFTKKDFSFLRSGLAIAGGAATMLVFLSLGFGFNLGIVFSVAMVVLAAGYILYQTSQVLAHYHTESYVAAALALFSSVALMFWYVIRIFLRARD